MRFIFCIACPEAPFIKLSIQETIIALSLCLDSQIDISHLLLFNTLPEPISLLREFTLTNFEVLYFSLIKYKIFLAVIPLLNLM